MKAALFALALVLLPLSALAADRAPANATVVLDEVVVSATRTEKKVDDAPSHVTVVTGQEMERRVVTTVDTALKNEAGVNVKRRKGIADSIADVQMRGLSGAERTLILLDGLPLNDGYSNNVPWNQISTETVERIEVIRGPGSALYGGHAMGGVVNIITKEPQEEFEGAARYGLGFLENEADVNLYTWGLSAGTAQDSFKLRVSLDGADSEGYATDLVKKSTSADAAGSKANSGYGMQDKTTGAPHWIVGDKGDNKLYRENVDAMLRVDLTDTSSLRLDAMHGHSQYWYINPQTYLDDGSYRGRAKAQEGARSAAINPRDFGGGRGKEETSRFALTYDTLFDDVSFTGKLGYVDKNKWYTSVSSRDANGNLVNNELDEQPGSLTESRAFSYFADLQSNMPLFTDNILTFGVYFRMDDYRQNEDFLERFLDRGSVVADKDMTMGRTREYAAFLQDEWKVLERLTLYAGARLDYWEAFDGESGLNAASVEHTDASDWDVSPRVAAVWNPLDDTYLRASASRGFRPPNIYEMYRTWTSTTGKTYISNPNLGPETLWTYEIGADQYFFERKLKLGATYFHSDVDDMVGSVTQANGDDKKENIGKVEIDGWEFDARLKPADWANLWATWTITSPKVKQNEAKPETEGKYVTDYPLETIGLGGDATWKWFTFSLSGNYQGRNYVDDTNTDTEGVYTGNSKVWLWDAKVICKPWEHLELSAAVLNLTDEDYFYYYVGQPRSYFFEVKVTF